MPPPDIPRELIDLIVDHLHQDVTALSALSLTCHTWSISARPRLFRKITLVEHETRDIIAFCSYLQSDADTSIVRHVEELIFTPGQLSDGGDVVPIRMWEIDLVLSKLPSLHTLFFHEMLLKPSNDSLLGWSSPRHLEKLSLVNVVIEPTDSDISSQNLLHSRTAVESSLDQILNLFCSIDHLRLEDVRWSETHYNAVARTVPRFKFEDVLTDPLFVPGASKISERLSIRKLSLAHDIDGPEVWTALKDSRFLRTLPVLELGKRCSDPNLYLHAARQTLRHITIDPNENVRFVMYHVPSNSD